ncbi:winged helix-turn-helix transcriptional regulator [Methanocella arvoryzae]|nr:winged helix-turn-helix transcriptional regulator [Methanocella arvoryzae]
MKKAHTFELTIVLLIVIMACLLYLILTSRPSLNSGWEASINSTPDYILPGSDGRLYAFAGNNVTAIDSNGQVAWKFDAEQDIWKGGRGYGVGAGGSLVRYYQSVPLAAEYAGHLYLLAEKPCVEEAKKVVINNITIMDFPMDLIALSPQGEIEWKRAINETFPVSGYLQVVEGPFYPDGPAYFWYPIISGPIVSGDRLYIFHDGQEDVYDANGTLAYKLYGLSSEPVVDERGYVYAVLATPISKQSATSSIDAGAYYVNVTPSSIIAAFRPDGTQAWSLDLGESAAPISVGTGGYTDGLSRLLFANQTLYVPVQNGIVAVSTDGRVLWVRHLNDGSYTLFEPMPVDPEGNVYFRQDRSIAQICVIRPNGQAQVSPWVFNFWSGEAEPGSQTPVFLEGHDGIVYGTGSTTYMSPDQFNETYRAGYFDPGHVTAYDLAKNRTLWTFTIPAEDTHALLLTPDNYELIHIQGLGLDIRPDNAGAYTSITQNRVIYVYPGQNVTYVTYEYTIHEDPIVLNQSRGMYVRALYALDNSGRLLWKEPIGSIKQAVVSNDTLYYSTWDGQMGGGASIAGGIAIIASLYLVLRFVAVGAVSRARAVLHVNENRNALMEYIEANPGSTAREITKGLPMNMGTLRYHLLILSMNHKITSHQDGDKYVRYFKNAGTYTREELMLLSLARREPVRKILETLSKNPGMTGTELSKALGVSTTAVYRHLNLLSERQIVGRELERESGPGYRVREEYLPYVERMIRGQ